jgi:hypothetical protein
MLLYIPAALPPMPTIDHSMLSDVEYVHLLKMEKTVGK